MNLRRALIAALVCIGACRSTERPNTNGSAGTNANPSATASPHPIPAGQQCLPAMICDDWADCALVAGDKVVAADRLAAGEPVSIGNGCTTGASCIAARAVPKGVVCPPHTIPPNIAPPPYTCVWDGTTCRKH